MADLITWNGKQAIDLRTNKNFPSKIIQLPVGQMVGLAPGTNVDCVVSYIQKQYSHVAPLATGDVKLVLFGAGYDATNDVIDWPGSAGLLTETPMADVIGMDLRVLGASYAAIPSLSSATQTILDALNTFANRTRLVTYKGLDVMQRDQGRQLLPTVGQFAIGATPYSYLALERTEKGNLSAMDAEAKGAVYYRAPIRIDRDTQFKAELEGFAGYTVASTLNGYLLIATAIVHEYPAELMNVIRG